uniref:Endonuclease PI-MtuI n=1 Tax=Mycobacterium tuberculosis TaxID=1773 RepID=UPI0001BE656C
CLAEGTRIFDPVTGTTHRIEDVVYGRKPIHVVAAAKDGTLHARPVVSWFDQGTRDVIGLRIAGGAIVWATPDHKVLTEYGWRAAGELRKGDRVAVRDVETGELRYSVIREVLPTRRARTFDLEVEELHTLVAEGVVVHN